MGQLPAKLVDKIGRFPEGYNARVHGAYSPAVYYGKKDTPFTKVTLEELPRWIGRRRFTPTAIGTCLSRALHRYHGKYVCVRKAGPRVAYLHWWCTGFILGCYLYHDRRYAHRHYKYH